jgi:hypothetical protein
VLFAGVTHAQDRQSHVVSEPLSVRSVVEQCGRPTGSAINEVRLRGDGTPEVKFLSRSPRIFTVARGSRDSSHDENSPLSYIRLSASMGTRDIEGLVNAARCIFAGTRDEGRFFGWSQFVATHPQTSMDVHMTGWTAHYEFSQDSGFASIVLKSTDYKPRQLDTPPTIESVKAAARDRFNTHFLPHSQCGGTDEYFYSMSGETLSIETAWLFPNATHFCSQGVIARIRVKDSILFSTLLFWQKERREVQYADIDLMKELGYIQDSEEPDLVRACGSVMAEGNGWLPSRLNGSLKRRNWSIRCQWEANNVGLFKTSVITFGP